MLDHRVGADELFEHGGVGGEARLGALGQRQAQLVDQYPRQLLGRVDGELVPEFEKGQIVESVLTITRDITRQKRAEVALLENCQILETVHRVGQVLAAELDLQKLVQVVTDAATELSRAEIGAFFYNVLDERGEEADARLQRAGVASETLDGDLAALRNDLDGAQRDDDRQHQEDRGDAKSDVHAFTPPTLPDRQLIGARGGTRWKSRADGATLASTPEVC